MGGRHRAPSGCGVVIVVGLLVFAFVVVATGYGKWWTF